MINDNDNDNDNTNSNDKNNDEINQSILVIGEGLPTIILKLNNIYCFKKILQHYYCKIYGLAKDKLELYYDEKPITDDDTPYSLNMDKKDYIVAFKRKTQTLYEENPVYNCLE